MKFFGSDLNDCKKESTFPELMHIPSVLIFAVLVGFSERVYAVAAAAAKTAQPAPVEQLEGDLKTLIRELGDESFQVRENASRKIWELGEKALPELQEALELPSPEQVYRARDLLRKIQLQITPETDPTVAALVERYQKATPSERFLLLGKMKKKQAWSQILKLYASETNAGIREKLVPDMNIISARAARERIVQGDAVGAREFLEMAPANSEGLLALAEFHRSHGTLEAELARAKTGKGQKAMLWLLSLERAAGNLQAARAAATAAGRPRIAAAMAVLSGDPLPWLLWPDKHVNGQDTPAAYASVAAKRWSGKPIRQADLEPLIRALSKRRPRDRESAMNALFVLGEFSAVEETFVKSDPLGAFRHFEALERIPEAFRALGLDPDQPDYQGWVKKRITILRADDIENQRGVSSVLEELVSLANFLERRGLGQQAFEVFSNPLAKLAEEDRNLFEDFLSALFGNRDVVTGAPMLAKRIGIVWAGDDNERWEALVATAFGNDETSSAWWNWLPELDPKASLAERFGGMLALSSIGPDPEKSRDRWMALAWKAAEQSPEESRNALVERIWELMAQTGDVTNGYKALKQLTDESRNRILWGQKVVFLTALGQWDDAAAIIIEQIDTHKAAKQPPGAELYAYAASALRRAGREDEAVIHDAWADKLALGDPGVAIRVGNGYAHGYDYKRAADWWARAVCESDPDSSDFPLALKIHADDLLERGRWKETAATSEVLARIFVNSDYRGSTPLPFMRQRLQADMARALGNLKTDREGSIALLELCHRNFASDGSLADFFFPALRKAGLLKKHDEWFRKTWNLMGAVIKKYPDSDNTLNTAAWFASRAVLKLDDAEKFLSVALDAYPYQSSYIDTMAEIHFAKGDRKKALEWSKRAVNYAPDDAQLRRQQERFRSAPLPKN